MSEINTGKILDGITLALRAAYPDCQIESDTIEQGLTPPAFLVVLVSAEQEKRAGERWRRLPRFDILYYPKAGREECYMAADNLCTILELITLPGGDRLRGTEISFEVVDGVLHFMISYNHFVRQKTEEIYMGELKIEQGGQSYVKNHRRS